MNRLTKRIPFPDGTETIDFSNKRVKEFLTDHKKGVKALFSELANYEDIAERGYVTDAKYICQKITYMRPIRHDYSDVENPNYYKYSCPVCDMLGNNHQVSKEDTNCPLCNVNLLWD